MVQGLIGRKIDQTQAFLEDGTRVPVTRVFVGQNTVTSVRNTEKNGYDAVQIGFGSKKKSNKAELGHVKGAKLEKATQFLKEVKSEGSDSLEVGAVIAPSDVFKAGDIIDVLGFSKGKGYAGVVKRHNFRGGPRTHGQSDRERAPGCIGQTTTPGRVYKGKRMAGRMGSENVTLKNLQVLEVKDGEVWVKGLIPGVRGSSVVIEKVGEGKKFVPLYAEKVEGPVQPEAEEPVQEAEPQAPEVQAEAQKESAEVQPEVPQEVNAAEPETKEEVKDAS